MDRTGGAEPVHSQEKIWQYFQNHGREAFSAAKPRLNYLVKEIARRTATRVPRVLNIGVGDGYFETTAHQRGWEIESLDPDETAIGRLREQGIRGHVGGIERLPFGDETFDFVAASEVLEHLADEQRRRGVREVARVLRRGGWFFGTVPYRERLEDNEAVCPRCGLVFHRWGHQRSFSPDDIRAELAPVFETVVVRRTAFVAFRGRSLRGKVKSLVRLVMARCGAMVAMPTIYFAARRGAHGHRERGV